LLFYAILSSIKKENLYLKKIYAQNKGRRFSTYEDFSLFNLRNESMFGSLIFYLKTFNPALCMSLYEVL